jgi:hypothetical protein
METWGKDALVVIRDIPCESGEPDERVIRYVDVYLKASGPLVDILRMQLELRWVSTPLLT